MDEMLSEIPGQTTIDRPDLMTRLFKIKLGQLMTDIQQNQIFGKHSAGTSPELLILFALLKLEMSHL